MTWTSSSVRGAADVVLGRQRAPQHAEGPHMVRYLRAANVKDGQLDLADVQTMNFSPTEQAVFALRPGDVLITEGSGSLRAVGASAVWEGELSGTVCFQNTLLRMRPRAGIDGRFLGWWARSAFASGLFASIASGANIYHLSAERVRSLELSRPPLEEQRRIADFLDAETSRIDRITVLRQRTLELVRERCNARLDELVRGAGGAETVPAEFAALGRVPRSWKQARLRSVECEVQTGPFGSQLHADDYVDDQWPVVNPANITPKGLVADPKVTITEDMRERLSRHVLREGDVVFGRRGELGRAAVVSARERGWLCGTGSLRLRFRTASFEPRYLHRYLQIPAVRHYFLLHAVGTTMANLNSSILLSMPLLFPSISEQRRIAAECDVVEENSNAHRALYQQQLKLLSERRQALITAAVTGQFDVSTASGRNTTQGV